MPEFVVSVDDSPRDLAQLAEELKVIPGCDGFVTEPGKIRVILTDENTDVQRESDIYAIIQGHKPKTKTEDDHKLGRLGFSKTQLRELYDLIVKELKKDGLLK